MNSPNVFGGVFMKEACLPEDLFQELTSVKADSLFP
jgi:hypothetical protein